jgi:hypothetical protein
VLTIRSAAAAAALGTALLLHAVAASARQAPVNADARIAAEFTVRVAEYVALHDKLEATLPARAAQPTPADVDAHERALTRLIAQSRSRAPQGAIFTPEIRAYFRRQIARALSGPDAAQIRDSIMDENPGKIRLSVNARYPDEIPLSTMPPQLLASLPKLPEALEYRFIGDRLILLDVHAHLVVDFIERALPR